MTNNTNGWKGQLANSFTKEGAWAILSGVLLAAIGYTIYIVLAYVGPLMTDWVASSRQLEQQNAANVEQLTRGQVATAKEYSTMLVTMQGLAKTQLVLTDTFVVALKQASTERDALIQSTLVLQEAIALRAGEHTDQQKQLLQIIDALEKASTMMKNVPAQRVEELKLLGDIHVTLLQMVEEIKKLSVRNGESKPPDTSRRVLDAAMALAAIGMVIAVGLIRAGKRG
jgi:hypothetical protein